MDFSLVVSRGVKDQAKNPPALRLQAARVQLFAASFPRPSPGANGSKKARKVVEGLDRTIFCPQWPGS